MPSPVGISRSAVPLKRDRAVVFLKENTRKGEGPAHVFAQRLAAGGREEFVGIFRLGMADQLVEELGADQRVRGGHGLAHQIVLDGAQGGADFPLDVGACGPKSKVDRDLIKAEFSEVVVKGGASAILHDAAQRIHLHVFAGLGVLATHERQLAVHHLDQRIGGIREAERGHPLNVGGQDHVVMRDPRQGKGAHRARLAVADGGGRAERDRGQQAEHTLALFDDDGALGHAFKAEQADLAEAGVEVGQDVDGLRHLGKRIAARVERVAGDGHGELLGKEGG